MVGALKREQIIHKKPMKNLLFFKYTDHMSNEFGRNWKLGLHPCINHVVILTKIRIMLGLSES